MKKSAVNSTFDPQVLAVLHLTGAVWRGLIAHTRGSTPVIVAHREFAGDRMNRVEEWLSEHSVGQMLCVLPAGHIICRNCPLPDASPEQLQQALQLQAEAHLLGVAPAHRVSMAVLPNAPGETTRTGLVLAWPEAAAFAAPKTTRPVKFVSEVAALAALLNGQRPDEALLWMDRVEGSVALAIAHPGGAVFRATREEASTSEDWQRRIGRIVAETSLGVGHTGAFIDAVVKSAQARASSLAPREARLFMPPQVLASAQTRLEKVSADTEWWSQYGIATGALLARTGALVGLTQLLATAPVVKPPPVRRVLEALATPRAATISLLACVLVLMLGPLVFSGLRLSILKVRFGDMREQLITAAEVRQKVALYQELEKQKSWPMTKLLADIATCTPIGIELESVRIESGKTFAVTGVALSPDGRTTPAQLVANMRENLARYGRNIFTEISVTAGKTDNIGRYRFDLSAKVNQPYAQPAVPEELDFLKTPYAVRLYGERAREGAAAGTTGGTPGAEALVSTATSRAQPTPHVRDDVDDDDVADDDEEAIFSSRAAATSRSDSAQPIGADWTTDRASVAVDPRAIPPELDEEQIKVMSVAEMRDALAKIGRARQSRELDQETKDRLKREWDMVMDYLRKAPTS